MEQRISWGRNWNTRVCTLKCSCYGKVLELGLGCWFWSNVLSNNVFVKFKLKLVIVWGSLRHVLSSICCRLTWLERWAELFLPTYFCSHHSHSYAMVLRGHSWRSFLPTVAYTCHTLIDRISANPISGLLLVVVRSLRRKDSKNIHDLWTQMTSIRYSYGSREMWAETLCKLFFLPG